MSRNCSKRNKQKVWRKTYGKPFLIRRAFKIAQLGVITAQSSMQIQTIGGAFGNAGSKALACANAVIDFHKAINSIDLNEGFKNE